VCVLARKENVEIMVIKSIDAPATQHFALNGVGGQET
jgi:hypothetical protein